MIYRTIRRPRPLSGLGYTLPAGGPSGPPDESQQPEVCSVGSGGFDSACLQRNANLGTQKGDNRLIWNAWLEAASFVNAANTGGAVDFSRLSPLAQRIVNGDSIQYSYGSTATYKPIEYPAYTPTPTQQIPATSTPSTPIQQTQQAPVYTPPPAVIVPTVSFTNLTTGNAAVLNIGDRWRISVTGPAGSQVVVTGGQGGRRDVTSMGTTDAAGRWTLEGTITADQVGQWSESWTVGGATAGAYSFTVPAPATNTSNTTGTNNQTGSTPANTGDTTTDLVGGGTSTDQAGGSTEVVGGSIIDQIISALPVSVQPTAQWIHDELSGMPGWGWIAVAAWILWFMNSRKGKR